MKVLFFSNSGSLGVQLSGTGNWVSTLIETLNREYPDIELCVCFYEPNITSIVYRQNGNVTLIALPKRQNLLSRVLHAWFVVDPYKRDVPLYIDVITKVKPDVIQIFGFESPFFRVIGNSTIPCFLHIQGFPAPYSFKLNNRISGWDALLATRLKNILLDADFRFIFNFRVKKKLKELESVYPRCNYYLGRTEWDRRCVQAVSPHARYFYCQEIMRPQFYKNNWVCKPKTTKTLYTTIRMASFKNVDMIFEAAFVLEKYNPDFDYSWRIVGISENELVPRIMKRKGKLPERLHLLGKKTGDEIIAEMLNADLFVYPSAIENGCNAIQEAMLVGIPVVATHAGGVSTTITDRVTGILVQEGDPYALAGAILEVFNDYNRAMIMAANARLVAHERHDPSIIANSLIEAYNAACNDVIIDDQVRDADV